MLYNFFLLSTGQRITTIQLDGVQYFVSRMNPYSPELNYFLAYQYCRSLGLQLASFETKEKVESMSQYLQNAGMSWCFFRITYNICNSLIKVTVNTTSGRREIDLVQACSYGWAQVYRLTRHSITLKILTMPYKRDYWIRLIITVIHRLNELLETGMPKFVFMSPSISEINIFTL